MVDKIDYIGIQHNQNLIKMLFKWKTIKTIIHSYFIYTFNVYNISC